MELKNFKEIKAYLKKSARVFLHGLIIKQICGFLVKKSWNSTQKLLCLEIFFMFDKLSTGFSKLLFWRTVFPVQVASLTRHFPYDRVFGAGTWVEDLKLLFIGLKGSDSDNHIGHIINRNGVPNLLGIAMQKLLISYADWKVHSRSCCEWVYPSFERL